MGRAQGVIGGYAGLPASWRLLPAFGSAKLRVGGVHMRNLVRFLVLGCLVLLPTAAQRGGGGHGGGGFHGGGGGFHSSVSGGFRGGAFVGSGFRGYGGFRYGFGRGFYGFGLGFYPYSYWPYDYDYGYPYYGYPGYGYGYSYPSSYYDYGYSSAPAVVYESDPAPPVRVYEAPRAARPEIREYSPGPSAHSSEKPIYLVAFRNQNNIRAAEAYWVTGGTLHFITLQHEQRQAPLDSVDRALTNRLNRERHVDLHLPAAD